jgi:hypothetical protein
MPNQQIAHTTLSLRGLFMSSEFPINYEILIQITLPFQTFVVLLASVMDKEAFEKHKAYIFSV